MISAKKTTKKQKQPKDTIETQVVSFFVLPEHHNHLRIETISKLKRTFNLDFNYDGDKIDILSSNIKQSRNLAYVFERLFDIVSSGYEYTDEDVIEFVKDVTPQPYHKSKFKSFYTTHDGVDISPRTEKQEDIIKSITHKTISVISGSAGCGKTMLSLAMGIKYLEANRYDKIIVIRPISEIGKSLGFMPGDYAEKLYNYSSPIMECLEMLIGKTKLDLYIKSNKIIFSSVTFLRGANIQNSYCIAEECQNLSIHEITSLMTRMNHNIKLVINGDISQSDIRRNEKSGLEYCLERLVIIDGIQITKLNKSDIQRHKLVSEIIDAFED